MAGHSGTSWLSRVASWLSRLVNVRRGEWPLLVVAFLFHFCLLAGYYVLRPIRDEIGSQHSDVLEVLWTWTFFALLVFVPLYSVVISRMPRHVFLPLVYVFLILNLVAFYVLFRSDSEAVVDVSERVFYVWTSTINLFAVSVFWGFMADIFRSAQGKRLFGPIAMGASLGGIVGPALVVWKVEDVGRPRFLLVSAAFFGLAVICVTLLHLLSRRTAGPSGREERAAADDERGEADTPRPRRPASIVHALRGLTAVFTSRYLLGIAAFIFLLALGNSFLYFEKSWLTREAIIDRAARTQFMGQIDLTVNVATLFVQGFVISRIIRLIGVGGTLASLPAINLLGFAVLGGALLWAGGLDEAREHTMLFLGILISFEVAQRVGRYAFARPAREVLFTVVGRSEKYESKAFIDTVVYRGGDVGSGWLFSGLLKGLGLSLGAIALATIPAFAIGIVLSLVLGVWQKGRADLLKGDMCPECNYDLRGRPNKGCPECGWGRGVRRTAD